MLFVQREGHDTNSLCACVLYSCLCEAITITVCVCGHWSPMSWYCSRSRTGPILRTWGTWVDVRGLTESKGLRPDPTQTLTNCVCCLYHCVLENKSFGGDTKNKGHPWAAGFFPPHLFVHFRSHRHIFAPVTVLFSPSLFPIWSCCQPQARIEVSNNVR